MCERAATVNSVSASKCEMCKRDVAVNRCQSSICKRAATVNRFQAPMYDCVKSAVTDWRQHRCVNVQ